MSTSHKGERGVTVMLVLVFMGIFLFLLGTILSYVLTQGKYGRALYAREQAVNVAESGLEYYRWFLAHNPSIMSDGTGLVSPYTYVATDPEGGQIGTATVTARANTSCGVVQSVDLTSVGRADIDQLYTRTLAARYMRPSTAEYSNLLNANVWAGDDRNITGPYFSNGGVRMDGTNNSTVQSAVSTWRCDSSFGCSPTQTKSGVWGSGSGSSLWSYPASSFDFAGIATNFGTLKAYAGASGILLDTNKVRVRGVQQGGTFSSVDDTDQRGYHVIFRGDDTIDVYRVTDTVGIYSMAADGTGVWRRDYHTITSERYVGRFSIPADCRLIYAQAKTWIEGEVGSKVTIVAADTGSFKPDIILQDDITYESSDGSSGLTAIAEGSVLIPLVVPDSMAVHGIFVAQTGYLGRDYYFYDSRDDHSVPRSYRSYVKRLQLTTMGTVVSNGRIGTKWTCGGDYCSGFNDRVDTYDRLLAFDPPPFTPASSPDYKLVLWREE